MRNVRQDRLNDYARMKGPDGASRDRSNLDYWALRASANSQIAPRASGAPAKSGSCEPGLDPPKLPSTKVNLRDTGMKPRVSRKVENAMVDAKRDRNDVGSTFMKSVRRTS